MRALVGSVVRGRMSGIARRAARWLLVVGTIPVGMLGVIFQSAVRGLFASPVPVAIFLMLNAFVMFGGEALRRRQSARGDRPAKPIERVNWLEGAGRRLAQSLALLPGISRSGASIVAGLLRSISTTKTPRTSRSYSRRRSFCSPACSRFPMLFAPGVTIGPVEAIAGCVVAGVTAYARSRF